VSFTGDHRHEPDWALVIDTALRCGVAGIVAQTWSPRPTHGEDSGSACLLQRTVRDLDVAWPSISVVVNAHNAQDTLEECLSHCDRLEYPDLEVLVVDDGSTDATTAIARAHPRAHLVTIPHRGLSAGRNVGYRRARGELIAYLDADAYPSPDWPWLIALAAMEGGVGGAGGPNIPPSEDPTSARVVAQSPGGPVPKLHDAFRAKHLPGCNMVFWRHILERLHGFDLALEGAEDVEFEWRVLRSGLELGYHPAALVWHHRRPGLRHYLRQQRHYGRSQAILERRYPELFPTGYRVRKLARRLSGWRERTAGVGSYRVRYLSLPEEATAPVELAHQWGVPAAVALGLTAPLGLLRRTLAAPAITSMAFLVALFTIDLLGAGEGRRRSERKLDFRARIAVARLLRPLAFRWGHLAGWRELRRTPPDWPPRPADTSAEELCPDRL
jgi:glycosyltransferase involved in cell wall biosynthesis